MKHLISIFFLIFVAEIVHACSLQVYVYLEGGESTGIDRINADDNANKGIYDESEKSESCGGYAISCDFLASNHLCASVHHHELV